MALVRKKIGPIATPDVIHWAPGLPKTRSGKIMRRILRKVPARGPGRGRGTHAARFGFWLVVTAPSLRPQLAHHEEDHLGDISTLADPSVVATLLELRGK